MTQRVLRAFAADETELEIEEFDFLDPAKDTPDTRQSTINLAKNSAQTEKNEFGSALKQLLTITTCQKT